MTQPAAARMTSALVVLAAAAALLVGAGSPVSAATPRRSAEREMVDQINASRAAYGLPRLTVNVQMVRHGRAWARRMARDNRVYHRPNLAEVVDGNFDRLTDNVGYTALLGASDRTLVTRLHQAFMASYGHRAQILGRYNQVGVGIHRASGGRMWVAVNFLKGPIGGFPLYRDTGSSPHENAIENLFLRGAAKGCTSSRFCTSSTPSRTYLASMLDRATATSSAGYHVAATCGSDSYCRDSDVTRRQLAIMVAEAVDLDAAWGYQFTDVRDSDRAAINAVVAAGIMAGCDSDRFCPGRTVTRAQAASVVHRAID